MRNYDDSEWVEYGHTMEEYLGGLTKCGFWINRYVECQMEDITELQFMTRAVKPDCMCDRESSLSAEKLNMENCGRTKK